MRLQPVSRPRRRIFPAVFFMPRPSRCRRGRWCRIGLVFLGRTTMRRATRRSCSTIGTPPGGPSVAAFDKKTGKLVWGAGDKWGPSYASPIPAVVQGKRRVFVFAGGESRPASGGLMCIDPADGHVDFTFPWRGKRYESVNASSPMVSGNRVYVSECYGRGGAMVDVAPDLTAKAAWASEKLGTHFMTAIAKD